MSQSERPWPSLRRVYAIFFLTPVLLLGVTTTVITIGVIRAGGDRSVVPDVVASGMPYILMINHALLFAVLLAFLKWDRMTLEDIGWTRPRKATLLARECALGLGAGVSIYLLQHYALDPLSSMLRSASGADYAAGASLGRSAAALTVATVFAGVVEESVFRGYALTRLSSRINVLPAVLVSTLAFTVGLHFGMGWASMLVVFVNGLLLSGLFVWRRNLIAPVIAHALINALVLLKILP